MAKVFSYLTRKQAAQPAFSASCPSLTEQHHKKDCDINTIMAFYKKYATLPDGVCSSRRPMYGDFSDTLDYYEAQNFVLAAKSQFDQLPADIRSRFDNDPGKLLAFLDDPKNADEAEKLGLIVRDHKMEVEKTVETVTAEGGEN